MSLSASLPNVSEGGARFAGPSRRRAAAAFVLTLVVGLVVGRFAFLRIDDTTPPAATPPAAAGDLDAATDALARAPHDPAVLTRAGLAYLAAAHRTADPSFYARAEATIAEARAVAPGDTSAVVAAGLLALARHDFTGALELARVARAATPLAADPLGVEVDALVELGRYDDAATAVDEMVRRRPDVGSLSRASYVLELRGQRDGALETMQQAVAAAGGRGADAGYVTALLGDLLLGRGNLMGADAAYARSLAAQPDQPQAQLGRARVAVARGDLTKASALLAALTDRLPLPDAVSLHGDVLSALGDTAGATAQYDLVRAIEELNRSTGGIAVDLELARFEVGQVGRPGGDAQRAVQLAETARAARPTVFADDILAWANRAAGRPADALPLARSAVRQGTGDATLWWHLAAIEADLGNASDARLHLEHSAFARRSAPPCRAGGGGRPGRATRDADLGLGPPAGVVHLSRR